VETAGERARVGFGGRSEAFGLERGEDEGVDLGAGPGGVRLRWNLDASGRLKGPVKVGVRRRRGLGGIREGEEGREPDEREEAQEAFHRAITMGDVG
jgi:hypothetical protein